MVSLRAARRLLTSLVLLASAATVRCGDMSADEVRAKLAELSALRAGKSVVANFEERKFLPMMADPITESGMIAFEPPGKFLRRTADGNLAVCNGTTLSMYYPKFKQLEEYPMADPRGPGAIFGMLARVFQLTGVEDIFRVRGESLPDGVRFVLVPKQGGLRQFVSRAVVEIDGDSRMRSSVLESPSGDRVETRYSGERFVPEGSTDFGISAPAGTTVVKPFGR